jgi:hypothetical protein
VQALRQRGVIRIKDLFPQLQRPPQERLSLRVPALGAVDLSEVVQTGGEPRVVGAKSLGGHQARLELLLGFLVAPLGIALAASIRIHLPAFAPCFGGVHRSTS